MASISASSAAILVPMAIIRSSRRFRSTRSRSIRPRLRAVESVAYPITDRMKALAGLPRFPAVRERTTISVARAMDAKRVGCGPPLPSLQLTVTWKIRTAL